MGPRNLQMHVVNAARNACVAWDLRPANLGTTRFATVRTRTHGPTLRAMPIESTPLAIGERRFRLDARDGTCLHARLEGRSPYAGLWIPDSITTEEGGDAASSRHAFARAFA